VTCASTPTPRLGPGPRTSPGRADPWALLAPTSRWAGKQWPADRFVALARRLLASGAGRVVIVGGPGERAQIRPLVDWAASEPRATDLVGETSIAQVMAVIERASLVVANDSAALHMAVGFDRPLVALFGPTRVGLVGPYRRDADVLQHPRPGDRFAHKDERAGRPMMARLTLNEVSDACLARLRGTA
jgi:heptosyltransferase-3